jgi:Mn-dependent DtxR family transcriptional regulator
MTDKSNSLTVAHRNLLRSIPESAEGEAAKRIALSAQTDHDLGMDRGDVVEACELLIDKGYVTEVDSMTYRLTEAGRKLVSDGFDQ